MSAQDPVPSPSDTQPAIRRGREAVADELWAQHCVLTHKAKQPRPDGWGLTAASALIDAWLRASNPVGERETIYDDYYRLRAVARMVLTAWDTQDRPSGPDPINAIEGLREVLLHG